MTVVVVQDHERGIFTIREFAENNRIYSKLQRENGNIMKKQVEDYKKVRSFNEHQYFRCVGSTLATDAFHRILSCLRELLVPGNQRDNKNSHNVEFKQEDRMF